MGALWQLLAKPVTIGWTVLSGLASLIPVWGLDTSFSGQTKGLIAAIVFLLCLVFGLLIQSRNLFLQRRAPVAIKTIVAGQHIFKGTLVLILDRCEWVEVEQLLVLNQFAGGVQTPIALLRVESFTTERYPQCVIEKALTEDNLGALLADQARWRSLMALSEIKARYVEGG